MSVGDLASFRIHFQGALERTECTFGLRSKTDDPLWRRTAANEFLGSPADLWRLCISNTARLDQITVSDVYPGTGLDYNTTPVFPLTGLVVAPQYPAQVAAVLHLITARQGRSYRGRMYLGHIPIGGDATSQSMSSDQRDNMFNLANDIDGVFNADYGSSVAAEWVVISRKSNGVLRPVPTAEPIVSWDVNPAWGTVRRRILAYN